MDESRIKQRERVKRWRVKNRDKVLEIQRRSAAKRRADPDKVVQIRDYQAKYRADNRERLSASERERKYGISRAEYAELFHSQNGLCAICHKPETGKARNGKPKALAVDHCHTTGIVRGLLCERCNKGIGYLGDDVSVLHSAAQYLNTYTCEHVDSNPEKR